MKMKAIAVLLGLALSTGVATACPNDKFQRQGGSFKWMVTGNFNGSTFQRQGSGLRSLRQLFREGRAKVRAARKDGDRGIVRDLTIKIRATGKKPGRLLVPRRGNEPT